MRGCVCVCVCVFMVPAYGSKDHANMTCHVRLTIPARAIHFRRSCSGVWHARSTLPQAVDASGKLDPISDQSCVAPEKDGPL